MSIECKNNDMNSRVKTLFGLVVLVSWILLVGNLTRADEVGWGALKTDKIQIQDFSSGQGQVISSYPVLLHRLLTHVLSWDPKKELNNSTQLAPILLKRQNAADRGFDLTEMMRNLSIEFDVSDIQNFRKVWFVFKSELKVRGLFAIHDFKKVRPLVILRMGVHGNVDELLAERFILKALYEDLDVNVLVLENLTSHAFLSQNLQATFGGMEEGLHTFSIIQQLSQANYPLRPLISTFHLVGVSLGGQGTFVTALLDSANGSQVKSILDFCPLINLEDTFEAHAQKGLKNVGIDLWNHHRLQAVRSSYRDQMRDVEIWKMPFDLKPRFTPRMLEILNDERKIPLLTAEDLKKQIPGIKWPQGFYEQITQAKSFYQLNDFWKLFHNVSTPIMIYYTPNDFLVMNELNTDRILEKKQPGDFKNVKIKLLERGVHCGLASAYIWNDVVQMIKEGLGI